MRFRTSAKFSAQVWDSGRIVIYSNASAAVKSEYVPESHLQCTATCVRWEVGLKSRAGNIANLTTRAKPSQFRFSNSMNSLQSIIPCTPEPNYRAATLSGSSRGARFAVDGFQMSEIAVVVSFSSCFSPGGQLTRPWRTRWNCDHFRCVGS